MLRVEKVSFAYRHSEVLHDVSFEAADGELTAIVGANAVGKSTLLKLLAGVHRGRGEVWLGDAALHTLGAAELTRRVGYLAQENDAGAMLSVFEVVLLGRMLSGSLRVPPEDLEAVWQTLRDLRIDGIAQRMFHQLSGGQRRMVAIAQTLVRRPPILILDEPTANLDLQNGLEVLELLRDYTRAHHTATVLTLHDLNMAARYADRVVVLREGRVLCDGTPREVFTPETLRDAYHIEAEITLDRHGAPVINPLRSVDAPDRND